MDSITTAFGNLFEGRQTLALLIVIALTALVGAIDALKDKQFTWSELTAIVRKVFDQWRLLAGWAGLSAVADAQLAGTIQTTVLSLLTAAASTPFALSIIKRVENLIGRKLPLRSIIGV